MVKDYCAVTCSLYESDCTTPFKNPLHVSLDSSNNVIGERNIPAGYSYDICYKCIDAAGNEAKNTYTWNVEQTPETACLGTVPVPTQNTLTYSAGSAGVTVVPVDGFVDWKTFFGITNSPSCDFTSCTLSDSGDCGGTLSPVKYADISMSSSVIPWSITASVTNPAGYSHSVCVRCTNSIGTTIDLDNWTIA